MRLIRNTLLALLLLPSLAFSATYYVDATGGLDTNDGLSEGQAWQTITKVNSVSLAAGDQVLLKAGETWTETLTPTDSGASGAVILFGKYGSGADPLINMEGGTGACVLIDSVEYVEVQDIDLIGSGTTSAFRVQGTAGSSGYTIKGRRIDVLRNYATTSGDCFSLDGSAQVELYDISATKCRPEPQSAGSHQAVTTHSTSLVRVYGATFSDSNYWFVGVQSSSGVFYDVVASGAYINGFEINSAGGSFEVYNSDLTVDVGGGLAVISGGDATTTGLIKDSTITATSTKVTLNRNGTITFDNCDFDISTSTWNIQGWGGNVVVKDSAFDVTSGANLFVADNGGSVSLLRNGISFNGATNYALGIYDDGGKSYVHNNIFKNFGNYVVWVRPSAINGPDVYNNTFYNCAVGIDNDGDNGASPLNIKNNIFHTVTDPIAGATGADISHNIYFNSADEGGVGSLTSDPLFVSAGTDFHLISTSPAIDSGIDVGLTTDYAGVAVPVGLGFDIGAYEYFVAGLENWVDLSNWTDLNNSTELNNATQLGN